MTKLRAKVNMIAENAEIEAAQNLLDLQVVLELLPHYGIFSLGYDFSYGWSSFY